MVNQNEQQAQAYLENNQTIYRLEDVACNKIQICMLLEVPHRDSEVSSMQQRSGPSRPA